MPPRRITKSKYGPYFRSSAKYERKPIPRYMRYMDHNIARIALDKVTKQLEKADKKYMPMKYIPLHIAKSVNAMYSKQQRLIWTVANTEFE